MSPVNPHSVLAKWPAPTKHRMGYTVPPAASGGDPIPFYADCAKCGAKEPEIAGHLGEATPPHRPLLLVEPGGVIAREALYCAVCFAPMWEAADTAGATPSVGEGV